MVHDIVGTNKCHTVILIPHLPITIAEKIHHCHNDFVWKRLIVRKNFIILKYEMLF